MSKATLDAALLSDDIARKPRHRVFANTSEGHQQLLSWLPDQGATVVHARLEATGTYAEAVALALHEAKWFNGRLIETKTGCKAKVERCQVVNAILYVTNGDSSDLRENWPIQPTFPSPNTAIRRIWG